MGKARWRWRRKIVREDYMWDLIFTRDKKSVIKFYLVSETRKTNISIFALYACLGIFILPQVSEKMQHCKINCNVTNLLCKMGLSWLCCKFVAKSLWLYCNYLKNPSCSFSQSFFFQFVPYTVHSSCLYFFPTALFYLSNKHQNGTFLKMQWGCLPLNCIVLTNTFL